MRPLVPSEVQMTLKPPAALACKILQPSHPALQMSLPRLACCVTTQQEISHICLASQGSAVELGAKEYLDMNMGMLSRGLTHGYAAL